MYALYSLLLMVALIISAPWWLYQMLRHRKYRKGWRERLGNVPVRLKADSGVNTIWIHAVSVGEVLAISGVVGELLSQLPGWRIVVSTTTDSGQKLARERFGEANVFYLPLDLPFAITPYLQSLRPKLLILAESEFWPNLLRLTRESGAVVAVINSRVSDRSFPRYMRFKRPLRRILENVQIFLAQSDEDARRLIEIGAPRDRVHVSGNLKYEVKPPAKSALLGMVKAAIAQENIGPVLVAGSTLEGEEGLLLETFRVVVARYPSALLVLAPRHPERFDAIASLLESSQLRFERRSQCVDGASLAGEIFLLDSIGELASIYELADVAFVGGSLVPKGGHNILEAAQFGVPILVGPYTENFRVIVEAFRRADALRVVTAESLTATVLQLLEDAAAREGLGRRTLELSRSQQGATQRTVAVLLDLLPSRPLVFAGSPTSERHA